MTREELRQMIDKRNALLSKCKRVIKVIDKDKNLIALCDNEDTAAKFISYYGCDGVKIGDTRIILDENWCNAQNP